MAKKKIKITEKDSKLIIKYNLFSFQSALIVIIPIVIVLFLLSENVLLDFHNAILNTAGVDSLNVYQETAYITFTIFIPVVVIASSYATLFSFINTIEIKVTQESIVVNSSPLPTDNNNKPVPIKNIKYLFIKKDNASGIKYIYIKNDNGKSIKLLKGDILREVADLQKIKKTIMESFVDIDFGIIFQEVTDLQKIKKAIETFLDIECGDIIMQKEKEERENDNTSPYTLKKQSGIKSKIKKLKKGSTLDYKGKTWNIVNETRYDWYEGNTDKLFELLNTKGKTMLLFVQQNEDNSALWFESKLSIKEFKAKQTLFKEKLVAKQTQNSGNIFSSPERKQMKAKQLSYISEDQKQHLRILQYQNKDWFSFVGQKIEEDAFDAISNPNKS